MNSHLLILLLAAFITVGVAQSFNRTQVGVGNTCGGISPLTRWSRTSRSDTIQMNIDTSSCRFGSTPTYFTSITGTAGHYLLVGVNAIYEPNRDGFFINVRSLDNQTADTLMAWSAQYQWNVNWLGYTS